MTRLDEHKVRELWSRYKHQGDMQARDRLILAYAPLNAVGVTGDFDQFSTDSAGWRDELPAKPVHGKVRNWLFLDAHVATRKALYDVKF